MYVLHLHWHPPTRPTETETAGMLCWAESSDGQPPKIKPKKGAPHPFCAAPELLKPLLAPLAAEALLAEKKLVSLLLPTLKSGPQPSPQLQHDWDIVDSEAPTLTPWLVAGLWLPPVAAFDLLTALAGTENLPPHLVLGAETYYWHSVANLVLETLAQQKLLPVLAQADAQGKIFHARWLPVLDGSQDGPRLARLLEAMPPLCRAETDKPENAPSPRTVLDTFLNTMTDALARQWGATAVPSAVKGSDGADTAYNWLASLFNANPRVSGSTAQLSHLNQGHKNWRRNLHVAGDKTFRVAFRLEAPAQQADSAAKKNWNLHYLLQARDDPSLLVPAQQVWQTKGNVLTALNRRFEQPQEKLLAGLGYAARLFEPLRAGLKTSAPVALPLSTDDAFKFLRESAPLLEGSGFGVLVPPWWNKPGTRLGVRLKMGTKKGAKVETSTGAMSLENLISYKWELALGETTLTREEFDALVALKSPLVQIRGQWVQLDPEQIEAAIRFWEKQNLEAEVGLNEAVRMGLGTTETVEGLPVEKVEYEGWLADWMERFTGHEKLTPLPQPQSLQGQLRPYQQYGYSWLDFLRRWGMGACLADDMGLGKTIQTIAMLLREKEQKGALPGPSLLICPTSVVFNWQKEVERFAPALTTHIHQGAARLRGDELKQQAQKTDLLLTSYAVARRDAETLKEIGWFGLILDEAQNIKNPEAKQSQAIRRLPAQFRMALTGTPVENRLSELWSIMHFLNPGYLGSRHNFRQSFALPIERYGDEEAIGRLKKMASPFILRRVKTDPRVIQDLPDKQEMKVYCNLTEEQATLYESVVQKVMERLAESSGIERKGLVLSMLMQLKQVCNHPAQFLHQVGDGHTLTLDPDKPRSGKLTRLTEMLEEAVSVGDRVLIFTQFSEMGHLLKEHLNEALGVPSLFLYGDTPVKKREVMVKRFQEENNGPPIFILSLKAGGTGLNLTRANHVFHFDRWWNPAVENQATDRAFRIGQTRNVQVHKFICAGTLEEKIDDMIESKKALAQSIIGSGENWLTELSTDELRDLVALRREAVQ